MATHQCSSLCGSMSSSRPPPPTRVLCTGMPVRMVKLFYCGVDMQEDTVLCFGAYDGDQVLMPRKPAATAVATNFGAGSDASVLARVWLDVISGMLDCLFRCHLPDNEIAELDTEQILTYLEHCVPWDRSD